ncbi:MAG: O-antigen ligase family protein [Anaerolineales bacterium]|nr:O-antigen ligase family protein [Anaerolineales bacterium]
MPNRLSRACEAVMEAAWLLGLVVTPLFFNIFSSRVFEPDKITLMRSLALTALAAWLIKLISESGLRFDATRSQHASPAGFLRVPLVLPVAGLVLVYTIATVFSVAPTTSLYGSYQRLQGTFTTFSYLVLFGVLAANLRRRAQIERAVTLVIVCSLPAGLYGILQHYRLDPLPWGGDTTARVTGSMGNAIFLAAYLIMTAPVALGRVVTSFHGILTDEDPKRLPFNVARAAIYIFIFAVNLVAIWFTSSRGPWLGLLAGFFVFVVLLSLHWKARSLTLATIGVAALLAVFLVVLNIPNGPLQSVRQMPGIGRLGEVFETEGGTGRVRVLIWEGIINLITPHAPLQFPDGAADQWNAIRPLIGYGPEALYVAYNRFYPPDLAHYEARNASPDRSHNETFDALAFTGLLGLAVYLMLFVAVFYYALKWLGLITSATRRNVFLALVLGGGALMTVGFAVWQGPEFIGVGLPFGMLLGLIAFLTLYALVGLPREQAVDNQAVSAAEPWRAILLIGLFSAIVAHFTEIHFGIAIVSTRTHFWIYAGLMLVLGFILPRRVAAAEPAGVEETPARLRRRGRTATRLAVAPEAPRSTAEQWGPVLVGALLITLVLVTLGFDFMTNNNRSTQAGRIMINALTTLPSAEGGTPSYGILGLFAVTWLAGGALILLEEPQTMRGRNLWSTLAAGLLLALILALIGLIAITSHLAAIAGIAPTNLDELIASANSVAGTLTVFYGLAGLMVLGLAAALVVEAPLVSAGRGGARGRGQANRSPLAIVAYVGLPFLAVLSTVFLNMQVVQADVIYKTGLQFDDGGQPQAAVPLFQRALALAPGEDYYYLFLGRAYLNATNAITDTVQRDAILTDAEQQLMAARRLNPLNTDHTANLARLNRRWAELSSDSLRAQRTTNAEGYYAQAVLLSPNNAGLWNEWAALLFQVKGDAAAAQQKIDQSFALDREFDQTYQLQGDLYAWQAQQTSADTPEGQAQQQAFYQQAAEAYQAGITLVEGRNQGNGALRLSLASVLVAAGKLPEGIAAYQAALAKNDTGAYPPWQVYVAISQLYTQLGDPTQARANADLALQAAPEGDKPSVQAWIDQLATQP